jgi:hypothetical protein
VVEKIQHLERLAGALETKLGAIERMRLIKAERKKYRAIKQVIEIKRAKNVNG